MASDVAHKAASDNLNNRWHEGMDHDDRQNGVQSAFLLAYGHILQLLWRLKWPIVALAVPGIIFWLIKR